MLVILRENIENLGRIGDVVKVSDGYARNFLLPRNLVAKADEENVKALEHQKRILEKRRQAQLAVSQGLADRLSQYTCTITRKVGEKDKLFGSVSVGDIFDSLTRAGFEIQKKSVQLDSPIKALGNYSVTIRLEPEVSAKVKVSVVKEE